MQRRTLLASVSDEVSKVYDSLADNTATIDSLNSTIEKNKVDMEKLREANMSLFLRVGGDKPASEIHEDKTGIKPEPEKRKFEDLFDDKGGLKL